MEGVSSPNTGEQVINEPQPARRQAPARNRRLQRIADYRQEALASRDPLTANLGAINSDLMVIAYRLMKAARTTLARSPNLFEDLNSYLPGIQACSQLARQIHRLAKLGLRSRKVQGESGDEAGEEMKI
jgi:hypothetical protein